MATETIKRCDIFGTVGAERYEVCIRPVDAEGKVVSGDPVLVSQLDLSKRGLGRLEKFVKRGLAMPSNGADGDGC